MKTMNNEELEYYLRRVINEFNPSEQELLECMNRLLSDFNMHIVPRHPPSNSPGIERRKVTYRRKECQDFHKIYGDLKKK